MRKSRAAAAGLMAVCVLLLASCGAPTMFRPESTGGREIVSLTLVTFAILAGVLVVVWTLLFAAIIKFRRRPESEASQTRGSLRLEVLWTAIPLVIVGVLFGLTLRTTARLDPPSTVISLEIVGRQWWWHITYPTGGFDTANEIHVPVDRQVTALVTSSDVIHSFWVPQMGGKVDMIPGKVNRTTFLPVTTGTYLGECSEFCGPEHAKMRFLLVVDPPARFDAWFARQQQPAAAPAGAVATAGAKLIVGLPCAGCHTIRGTGMKGKVGPDLTHVGGRTTLAAATLANTPDNLRAWIADPAKAKPEVLMPKMPMPAQQLDQLVAYLEELE